MQQLAVRLYAALAKGDRPGVEELLHPDFVGTTTDGLPLGLGGRYDGPASMIDDFWWQVGRSFRAEAFPDEFHESEGRLVVEGRYRGEGRASGLPLDAAFVHVLTFENGLIHTLTQLTDSAAWEAALGVHRVVECTIAEGIAHLEFCRPHERNAISLQLAREFLQAVETIRADQSVRAVLISGRGPAFTVGGDIAYFLERSHEDLGPILAEMTTPFHEAFRILDSIDAPVVAAVHGAVAGGGLGFMYAADITIAAEGTKFVTAFADIALPGDGGGTWHLPRIIGSARARRIYLENRPITTQEALDWGLVAEVVPADELMDVAWAKVRRFAQGPTRTYGHMRSLLGHTWNRSLAEQLDAETRHLLAAGRDNDVREAVRAFDEKRPPRFEGR